MSAAATSEPAPPPVAAAPVEVDAAPQTPPTTPTSADVARDVTMWRRKDLSILVLSAATASWVALQVYQLHFLTVASWVAMFVVAILFIWGSIQRLLGKETPELSGMEISERWAVEMANAIREWVEEGVRWMLRVSSPSSKREVVELAAAVTSTRLLSQIGAHFDLLTLIYAGVVVGMSVPAIYVKYEHKLKEYGRRWRLQSHKCYQMIEDKVRMLKERVVAAANKKKSKKME